MAIAFVNRAEAVVGVPAVASLTTPATNHSAGNLLSVCVSFQATDLANTDIGSIADLAGNTYTQVGAEHVQIQNRLRIYRAYNCLGHASNQVTMTFNGAVAVATFCVISVRQFSGVQAASDPNDGDNGATGSGTAIDSGSVPVTAAEAVIVAIAEADGSSFVAGSGYTLNQFAGSDGQYFADEYKIVSASEAASMTSGSGPWGIAAAAFKAAAGAPSGNPWHYYAQQ